MEKQVLIRKGGRRRGFQPLKSLSRVFRRDGKEKIRRGEATKVKCVYRQDLYRQDTQFSNLTVPKFAYLAECEQSQEATTIPLSLGDSNTSAGRDVSLLSSFDSVRSGSGVEQVWVGSLEAPENLTPLAEHASFSQLDVPEIKETEQRSSPDNLVVNRTPSNLTKNKHKAEKKASVMNDEGEGTEIIFYSDRDADNFASAAFLNESEEVECGIFLSFKALGLTSEEEEPPPHKETEKKADLSTEHSMSSDKVALRDLEAAAVQELKANAPEEDQAIQRTSTRSDSVTWVSYDEDLDVADDRPVTEISFPTVSDEAVDTAPKKHSNRKRSEAKVTRSKVREVLDATKDLTKPDEGEGIFSSFVEFPKASFASYSEIPPLHLPGDKPADDLWNLKWPTWGTLEGAKARTPVDDMKDTEVTFSGPNDEVHSEVTDDIDEDVASSNETGEDEDDESVNLNRLTPLGLAPESQKKVVVGSKESSFRRVHTVATPDSFQLTPPRRPPQDELPSHRNVKSSPGIHAPVKLKKLYGGRIDQVSAREEKDGSPVPPEQSPSRAAGHKSSPVPRKSHYTSPVRDIEVIRKPRDDDISDIAIDPALEWPPRVLRKLPSIDGSGSLTWGTFEEKQMDFCGQKSLRSYCEPPSQDSLNMEGNSLQEIGYELASRVEELTREASSVVKKTVESFTREGSSALKNFMRSIK